MNEKKYQFKKNQEVVQEVTAVTQIIENQNQDVIDAAQVLLDYLPEDIRRDIEEASQSMQLSVWQMLLGYIVRCWDGKLVYAPFLLSSWETGRKPTSNHRCESCGRMFHSRFPDAKHCCNHCTFEKIEERGHSENCPAMIDGN